MRGKIDGHAGGDVRVDALRISVQAESHVGVEAQVGYLRARKRTESRASSVNSFNATEPVS